MGLFSDYFEKELDKGIILEDIMRRFGAYLDAWIAGDSENYWKQQIERRVARLEARVDRLEAVSKADKQTLDEVDGSVRQTWESLDTRIRNLEELCKA